MGSSAFNILSLCTGIGGLELGLKLACPEARTICYCEREAYCIEVLVKKIKEKSLDDAPIWSDITTFNGRPWCNRVDCLTGGYPCTPFSSLGKKLGKEDERWLWEHIARIIEEVKPEWCFFENVSAHLRMGFEQVHDDLQRMGYRVATGVFTAAEVGAGHKRERLFLLAHSVSNRRIEKRIYSNLDEPSQAIEKEKFEIERFAHAVDDGCAVVGNESKSHTNDMPMDMGFPAEPNSAIWREFRLQSFPIVEPSILGEINGLSVEMDRLRCCGNAVVPLVAGYAFHVLRRALEENSIIPSFTS